MKFNFFILFLIIILIPLSFALINKTITGKIITGEVITGKATFGNVSITINLNGLAAIQIDSPINGTYSINEIQLNISSGAPLIEYMIDNMQRKIFSGNGELIALGIGFHNITFFATNNYGITKKTIYFSINNTLFEVLYKNFSNSSLTTNFIYLTYEKMQTLNNIIIENSIFGRIEFKETINITNDKIHDKLLNLDSNIKINQNEIFLNITELPNFNKNAIITFYKAQFKNPMLLKNGVDCKNECVLIGYNYFEKKISYNIPEFAKYNLIETPKETVSVSSKKGGGGGGKINTLEKLNIKDTLNVIIIKGQVTNAGIPIKNLGETSLHLLVNSNLKELININKTEYFIRSRESDLIKLDFFAKENFPIGIHTGKIFLDFQGKIKEILVTIEVKSPFSAFDVEVKIPNRYKKILVGENILTQTQVWNFKKVDKIEVKLKHIIKDINGKEITSFEKLLTIKTQSNFIDEIFLPKLKPGKYFIYTQISHDNIYASSSDEFIITEPILKNKNKLIIYLIILIAIILLLIMIILLYRRRKNPKRLLRRIYKHKYDKRGFNFRNSRNSARR